VRDYITKSKWQSTREKSYTPVAQTSTLSLVKRKNKK